MKSYYYLTPDGQTFDTPAEARKWIRYKLRTDKGTHNIRGSKWMYCKVYTGNRPTVFYNWLNKSI